MNCILAVSNVSKSYSVNGAEQHTILKDIHLQVLRGEFVTIMGPSGSGKSTLLYNISGMDQVSAGQVEFKGKDITSMSEKSLSQLRLMNMGFIFQHIHLLKNLNIFDNIVLSAYLAKKSSKEVINNRAISLMKSTGIESLANRDITAASGGQLQRVAICRALINEPDILFGDEPTGALNSRSSNEIMDILADINAAGTTILLITHDIKVAAKSERVIFMMDGSIVAQRSLGKYNGEQEGLKERESDLTAWLAELGF